ncbi:hypothetical protein CFO_g5021 [Ceratocystis platani]|uniref:CCHC-type domain-containing protein n=1 Tax=Ceratocystis fimbriata f. sp. platani TaxID=88771 RepID=A0A0F8D923_CERFI|nr:hypothetical protein CFO_g5021 [Ceratocystis platani]
MIAPTASQWKVDVHPSTITKSRDWLSNVEIEVDLKDLRSSILDAKLPTIEEITYSEWAELFQDAIIISKTSALFDTAEWKEKTAQLVVAQKIWRQELARCAPLTIFEKDDTFSSILTAIHETSKRAEDMLVGRALHEIEATKVTSLKDMSNIVAYIRPRITMLNLHMGDSTIVFLRLHFHWQLLPLDSALAKAVYDSKTPNELLKQLADRATVIKTVPAQSQCNYCGKAGHKEKVCMKKKRDEKKEKVKQEGDSSED